MVAALLKHFQQGFDEVKFVEEVEEEVVIVEVGNPESTMDCHRYRGTYRHMRRG